MINILWPTASVGDLAAKETIHAVVVSMLKHNCIGAEQRRQIRDDLASVFATYFYRTFGDGHVNQFTQDFGAAIIKIRARQQNSRRQSQPLVLLFRRVILRSTSIGHPRIDSGVLNRTPMARIRRRIKEQILEVGYPERAAPRRNFYRRAVLGESECVARSMSLNSSTWYRCRICVAINV